MGRYVLGEQSWTIERDDTTITQTLDGASTVEQLASRQIAAMRFNILVDQHVRAGWKLVREAVPATAAVAPSMPRAPVVHDARNPELEAAVAADPEALEPMLLLGDWLQQQGDPRGELIALRNARRERSRDDKLRVMVDAFEARHREYLFGSLGDGMITLGLGFGERISVTKGKLVDQLAAALALPACRFVTQIAIEGRGPRVLVAALDVIARDAPASLRHMWIGGRTMLASLGDLVQRLPVLRSLAFAHGTRAFREEYRLTLTPACVNELARAPMGRLERLRLDVIGVGVSELRPLLMRTDLPALTKLVLCTEYDADLVDALANTAIARQLDTLELAGLGEHQVERVVTKRALFPALKRLGVSHPRISIASHQRLSTVYPEVFYANPDE